MVRGDVTGDRIRVAKVACFLALNLSPLAHERVKLGKDPLRLLRLKSLIIVALIVVAPILCPVITYNLLDAH